MIRAVIEETAEKGVSWVLTPIIAMFFGVIVSIVLTPANPVFFAYLYFITFELAHIREGERTEFDFFLSEIYSTSMQIPSFLGSFIYIYAGAIAGFNYQRALSIIKRNRERNSENYGLPVASVAGLLGIQLSLTKIRAEGSILQRVVGDPIYQLEDSDMEETIDLVLFSEVCLLIFGGLLTAIVYLIYSLFEFVL